MLALGQRHVMLLPVVLSIALPNIGPGADKAEQFETKIRPLLARNCFACHTQAKLGGLTLDTREGLLKGGKSGPAVVPGDPEKSLLFQAISHTHPSLKMPPNGELRHWRPDSIGRGDELGRLLDDFPSIGRSKPLYLDFINHQ